VNVGRPSSDARERTIIVWLRAPTKAPKDALPGEWSTDKTVHQLWEWWRKDSPDNNVANFADFF